MHDFDQFLRGHGLADSTTAEYVRLARHWTRHLDSRPPTPDVARQWADQLPPSRPTRKTAVAMLRWWQQWQLGEDVGLCQAVRVPARRRPDPQPLTTDQWEQLIATAVLVGGRRGLATLIICFTAARPSEVARMCWEHWDGRRLRWWRPKTCDWHELLAADRLRVALDAAAAAGPMFAGNNGRPCVSAQTVWGWVREVGRLAGVDVCPRRIRSTVATEVLERTGSIDVVAALLGHRSVDSSRHYAATSERRLDAAVAALET